MAAETISLRFVNKAYYISHVLAKELTHSCLNEIAEAHGAPVVVANGMTCSIAQAEVNKLIFRYCNRPFLYVPHLM